MVGTIIIVAGEAQFPRVERTVVDAVVEVKKVGLIAVNDFVYTQFPLVKEGIALWMPPFGSRFVDDGLRCSAVSCCSQSLRPHAALCDRLLGRAVETGIFWQEEIGGVFGHRERIHEVPVLYPMIRYAKLQSFSAYGFGQFADDVAPGPHLFGIPLRQFAVVHGEAVVVFGSGNDITRTSLPEEGCPLLRVELFSLEQMKSL